MTEYRHVNPDLGDLDEYRVGTRADARLCPVCADAGPTGLHIRLTTEERANLPAPGTPGLCTNCGSRRAGGAE